MTPLPLTSDDLIRLRAINARIPGWSSPVHYGFFKSILADLFCRFETPRLLILGVYHGRDLAYLLDLIAHEHPGRTAYLTGVDKFNAEPCDDWPAEKRHLTWEQAFHCPPPDHARAQANLAALVGEVELQVVQQPDADFLAQTRERYDFIYLDTSHDYATVHRQLAQVRDVCFNLATIIAGDDYSDAGTWGVKRAVADGFTRHTVFSDWIWHAPAGALRPPLFPSTRAA